MIEMRPISVAEYVSVVAQIHRDLSIAPPKTLWFRGQSNAAWDLVPSIYRSANLNYYEREMIRDFKLSAVQFLNEQPSSELEWMFVMQHYGLPTRLLDWSESHFIALLFAVIEFEKPGDAAVWVFRPALLNNIVLGEITITTASNPVLNDYVLGPTYLRQRKLVGESPIALRAAWNSPRISAQKGGFTLHGRSPQSLNDFIEEKNLTAKRAAPLFRITIPADRKKEFVTELVLAGTSHSVLFPEIQGICADIKMRYSECFAAIGKLDEL